MGKFAVFHLFGAMIAVSVMGVQADAMDEESALGIVNGQKANLGQFPHQILMSSRDIFGRTSLCGGSIVDDKTVITAAHCLPRYVRRITIYAGITNRRDTSGGQTFSGDTRRSYRHPRYNRPRNLENDLAVIKLTSSIQFNENVQPISFCDQVPAEGTSCLASGWGTAGPIAGSGSASEDLQFVEMQYYNRYRCSAVETGFCARAPNGGGVCSGDSGGPLTCSSNGGKCLLGVASYVENSCGSGDGTDDVFQDVTKNQSFLQDATE